MKNFIFVRSVEVHLNMYLSVYPLILSAHTHKSYTCPFSDVMPDCLHYPVWGKVHVIDRVVVVVNTKIAISRDVGI